MKELSFPALGLRAGWDILELVQFNAGAWK